MPEALSHPAPIDGALAAGLAVSALVAFFTGHRGGHFRGLMGWVGFWVVLALILSALSHLSAWFSLPVLAVLMFVALRTFFFLAPVRPGDRYAILAAYLAVPLALYPAWAGPDSFLAIVPVALFLLFPVLLSVGGARGGLLESLGRVLLGLLLFVFCPAHLALLVRWPHAEVLELFGLLAISAELPQRLAGRFARDRGWARPALGVLVGAVLATGLGFRLGPWVGLVEEDAARAGLLLAIASTLGALVSDALMRDLALGSSATRVGRAAFLDRAIPAVYAAPVFFHYLNHFA